MPRNRWGDSKDEPKPPNDPIEPIASLTASRDVKIVQEVVRRKYGDNLSDEFTKDFIDFVEALTDGQQ